MFDDTADLCEKYPRLPTLNTGDDYFLEQRPLAKSKFRRWTKHLQLALSISLPDTCQDFHSHILPNPEPDLQFLKNNRLRHVACYMVQSFGDELQQEIEDAARCGSFYNDVQRNVTAFHVLRDPFALWSYLLAVNRFINEGTPIGRIKTSDYF